MQRLDNSSSPQNIGVAVLALGPPATEFPMRALKLPKGKVQSRFYRNVENLSKIFALLIQALAIIAALINLLHRK
jgi:hypothetical protein